MQDQPNDLDGRVDGLDDSVERLTSELTSLKLGLATLASAIHELPREDARDIVPPRQRLSAIHPQIKPSMVPGAVIVAVVLGVLSWQLFLTPRAHSTVPPASASANAVVGPPASAALVETTATQQALTPHTGPTFYRGTLTIRSDHPGAHVFVNRKLVGNAPVSLTNLRAGSHLVWVESDGYRRWTRVVTVPAERVTRVEADLEPIEVVR